MGLQDSTCKDRTCRRWKIPGHTCSHSSTTCIYSLRKQVKTGPPPGTTTSLSTPETQKSIKVDGADKQTIYRDSKYVSTDSGKIKMNANTCLASGGKRDCFVGFRPAIKSFVHNLKFEEKTYAETSMPVNDTPYGVAMTMERVFSIPTPAYLR